MLTTDLSGPCPADPMARIAAGNLVSNAQRGFDIATLAPMFWLVCKRCDLETLMNAADGRSFCCGAPVRMQGWAAPAELLQ